MQSYLDTSCSESTWRGPTGHPKQVLLRNLPPCCPPSGLRGEWDSDCDRTTTHPSGSTGVYGGLVGHVAGRVGTGRSRTVVERPQ